MQTKLCPKCGQVNPDEAKKCDCGYSFERDETPGDEDRRRRALAQWLGAGRLEVLPFGVACAIVWGLALFLTTWWIILFDGATGEATFLAKVYRGYSVGPVGSFVGLAWGLIDGFVVGAALAWLYNLASVLLAGFRR